MGISPRKHRVVSQCPFQRYDWSKLDNILITAVAVPILTLLLAAHYISTKLTSSLHLAPYYLAPYFSFNQLFVIYIMPRKAPWNEEQKAKRQEENRRYVSNPEALAKKRERD